jgi:hypothetical protein
MSYSILPLASLPERRRWGPYSTKKKGKRVDNVPAKCSKSKEPTKKQKRGRRARSPVAMRAQGRNEEDDEDDDEALAVDPPARALEAPACSMTC